MQPQQMRRAVEIARVAHLATVSTEGDPHLVPICCVLVNEVVYTAVDHKPKRSGRLRRTANIEATGRACVLVDGYSEEWDALWWVRVDGHARVVADPDERAQALTALGAKYGQYATRPPTGPVLALDVTGWVGWAAAD